MSFSDDKYEAIRRVVPLLEKNMGRMAQVFTGACVAIAVIGIGIGAYAPGV